jgi:hypothetical protein
MLLLDVSRRSITIADACFPGGLIYFAETPQPTLHQSRACDALVQLMRMTVGSYQDKNNAFTSGITPACVRGSISELTAADFGRDIVSGTTLG